MREFKIAAFGGLSAEAIEAHLGLYKGYAEQTAAVRKQLQGGAKASPDTAVLVPRETPLSAIHLEVLLKLRQAGALILPAMPAFYTQPDSLADVVDFVAGKALDLLGVEHDLLRRWGTGQ